MLKDFIKAILPNAEEPELKFDDGIVFYNYVFDLGPDVNPIEAGRRLLKTNYARALTNFATGQIELSDLFRSTLAIRNRVSKFSELSDRLKRKGLINAFLWILRHPGFSLRLAVDIYKGRRTKSTAGGSQQGETSENGDSMEQLLNEIDDKIHNLQKGIGLHRFSDMQLFSEIYLQDIPFVRLDLYPVDITSRGQKSEMDVELLIHRTGICILTFFKVLSGQRTVDDLLKLRILQQIPIEKVRVPDAVMGITAIASGIATPRSVEKYLRAQTARGSSEGYEFDFSALNSSEQYKLSDVFEWYRLAVTSTVTSISPADKKFWQKLRSADWRAYPIFFLRPAPQLNINSAQRLQRKYPTQLAGLLSGYELWRGLNKAAVNKFMKDDHSLTEDQSFYIGLSHSTVIHFQSNRDSETGNYSGPMLGNQWIFGHFQRSSLIDVLLIQQWVLHVLGREIRLLPSQIKSLNKVKRSLLLALEEYHQFIVSYGTAQEIIKNAQETLLIKDSYDSIGSNLSMLEKIIDVEESMRRYRRDLSLRWVATAATLVLGLPGAKQVALVISSWKAPIWTEDLPFIGQLVRQILFISQFHPNKFTAIIYVILLITILPGLLWSVGQGAQKKTILTLDQSPPEHLPAFTWPSEVEFRSGK